MRASFFNDLVDRHLHGVIVWFAFSLLCACAGSPPATEPPPGGGPLEGFRVLTYNTLHGLEVGSFWVRPGESKAERTERFKHQYAQLAVVQPDLILLQEVNPLPEKAQAYVDAMRSFGLEYSAIHQADACGIRLGRGLIPGLNNGLAVLAKSPLRLRKLSGLKLSGGLGGCTDLVGFQTGAHRYALIAEVENPGTGNKILAVSLHLHSGIERSEFFIRQIREAKAQGQLPDPEHFDKLLAALVADQDRRIGEIRTLMQELKRLKAQAQQDYLSVIIGGDFNFEPDSPEYRELELAGLQDSHAIAQHETELHTYDPQNPIAGYEKEALPAALTRAIRGLPESRRRNIIAEYRKGVSEPRRIDFLFTMQGSSPWTREVCMQQELFGMPHPESVVTGSDHYGLLNTYIFDREHC